MYLGVKIFLAIIFVAMLLELACYCYLLLTHQLDDDNDIPLGG